MRRYLVGGAVRDRLLGRPVHERDWVVVGATPEDMIARGFKPVGRDFPVFLDPQSNEEHALARTERKSGRGYHGFTFHTGADVTLEDDLRRRDLTINAIAEDEHGHIIDPCGGRDDLERRLLRHVSPAFAEDPVRILRTARFAARYQPLGFRVADETLRLMRDMSAAGEVDALVPERVWQETERALQEPAPATFFEILKATGALAKIFPEVAALFGVPQPPRYHPEIDSGVHTLMALAQAARLDASGPARFAVLCHDLGKALTPRAAWPSHHGHEQRGLAPLGQLCDRLRVPNDYRDLARLVTRYHLHVHRALELRPATLLKLFEALDAFRRPQRVDPFLLACEADARGRTGFEDRAYPQADFVRDALGVASAVQTQAIVAAGYHGAAVGRELRRQRVRALTDWKRARPHAGADADGSGNDGGSSASGR